MPLDGNDVFTLVAGYAGTTGNAILTSQHNPVLEDIRDVMNTTLSVKRGGTGSTTIGAAQTALDVPSLTDANTLAGAQTLSSTLDVAGRVEMDTRLRVGNSLIDAELGATIPTLVAAASVNAGHSWAPIDSTEMMVVRNGDCALDIVSTSLASSVINFGDEAEEDAGSLDFDHTVNDFLFKLSGTTKLTIANATVTASGALAAATVSGGMIPSQAEAEAGTLNNHVMTPLRTAQAIANQVADPEVVAWVNFEGIGAITINGNKNVSSVTDNAVGNFTVNFNTALASANYAVSTTTVSFTVGNIGMWACVAGDKTSGPTTKSTTACKVLIGASDGAEHDSSDVNLIFTL